MEASSKLRSSDSLQILVVDDHSINREFLKSALALKSFKVDEASSGPEAIDCCRRVEYDLILMDLHMPGQTGIETATAIQALDTGSADASIIFLTADTRDDALRQLHVAGFSRVLTKPVSIDTLINQLTSWQMLDGSPADRVRSSSGTGRLFDDEAALSACHGQIELVAKMKRMFADDLDMRLGELEQRIKDGKPSDAAAILHQWAGAAAYAGASKLSQRIGPLRSALLDQTASPSRNSSLAHAYLDFLRCARATSAALRRP